MTKKRERVKMRTSPSTLKMMKRKKMRVKVTSMMTMMIILLLVWEVKRSSVKRACPGKRWKGGLRKRTARPLPGGLAWKLHRNSPTTSVDLLPQAAVE
jgi:hypothetical protein